MRSTDTRSLAAIIILVLTGAPLADAATVLTKEPAEGQLRAGQRVLVNDGTCPSGQIKEVIGGGNRKYQTSTAQQGAARVIRCIPR
jgi:hypothetical protein